MRSLIASLVVVIGALVSVAWATDGFRALTSEQARSLAVAANPVPIPDVDLLTPDGSTQSLHKVLSAQPGVTIVGFFYSSCETICLAMASDFQHMQLRIQEQGLEQQVRLLSISFDPAHDSADVLSAYQKRLGVDEDSWRVVAVKDSADLPRLLNTFGIRVVDDQQGGFVHNSAFHVVNQQAELTAIVDFTRPNVVLSLAVGE